MWCSANLVLSEGMRPQKIQQSQDMWKHQKMLLIGKFLGFEVNSASKLCSYHGQVPGKTDLHLNGALSPGWRGGGVGGCYVLVKTTHTHKISCEFSKYKPYPIFGDFSNTLGKNRNLAQVKFKSQPMSISAIHRQRVMNTSFCFHRLKKG